MENTALTELVNTTEQQIQELEGYMQQNQNILNNQTGVRTDIHLKTLKNSFQIDVIGVLNDLKINEGVGQQTMQKIESICNAINSLAIQCKVATVRADIYSALSQVTFPDNYKVPYFAQFDENRTLKPEYPVIKRNLVYVLLKDKNSDRYCMLQRPDGYGVSCLSGGVDGEEDRRLAASRETQEESGYQDVYFVKQLGDEFHLAYYHPTKHTNFYSVAKGYLFETDANGEQVIDPHEAEKHTVVWLTADEIRKQEGLESTILYLLDLMENITPQVETIDRYNPNNPHPDKSKWITK